jgi:hypothetical protein
MNLPEPGQTIQITTTGDIIVGFGWDIVSLDELEPADSRDSAIPYLTGRGA